MIVDGTGRVALRAPDAVYVVLWPHGYTVIGDGEGIQILDQSGQPVAMVGERISLGGAGIKTADGAPAWNACGEVVPVSQ